MGRTYVIEGFVQDHEIRRKPRPEVGGWGNGPAAPRIRVHVVLTLDEREAGPLAIDGLLLLEQECTSDQLRE